MSDRLFLTVAFVIAFLLLLLAGLAIWMLLESLRKGFGAAQSTEDDDSTQNPLLNKARKACGAKACCKCKHWDLETGQSQLAQNPAFMMAARQLQPSKMGRSVEDQSPPALPLALDRWELFGACAIENTARHATDKCDSFQKV